MASQLKHRLGQGDDGNELDNFEDLGNDIWGILTLPFSMLKCR